MATFGARTGGDLRPSGENWFGGFGASTLEGAALLAQDLPGGLELSYRSDTDGRPVVAVETTWQQATAPIGAIEARLVIGGQIKASAFFSGTGLQQRQALRFVLRSDTALTTGSHDAQVQLIANVGAGPQTTTFSDTVNVDNRGASAFGSGWTVSGLERLVPDSAGALYLSGTGVDYHFAGSSGGGGGVQTNSSNQMVFVEGDGVLDGSALQKNLDGSYTLTFRDGRRSEFNAAGLLTSRVDLNGNATNFAYSTGNLTAVTDPFGRQTTFAYAGGRVSAVTDWAGRTASLGRDGSGRLTSVTPNDPDGNGPLQAPVTSFGYNAAGRVSSVMDPLNHQTTLTYDAGGRLDVGTLPGNVAWQFDPIATYGLPNVAGGVGTSSNPATIADPALAATVWTDPLNHQRRWSVNGNGDVVRYVDPSGAATLYQRDGDGRITQQTDPDPDGNGPLQSPVTVHQYDTQGNRTQTTHPNNAVEHWTYHATLPIPLTHTSPLNHVTTYSYDAKGNLLSVSDPLSHVTGFTYNTRGQVLTQTAPDPDGSGPLASPVTTFTYDTHGRRTSQTDPLAHTTTYAYDTADRPISTTGPDPDGNGPLPSPVTTTAYDALGRRTSTTDPLNHTTTFTYNANSQLLTTTDPANGLTSFAYDVLGRRTGLTDPVNNTTTWTYDALGRTLTETNQANAVRSFTYDANGRLTTKTDRTGQVSDYTYDALGRPTRERWLNGATVVKTITRTYDVASRLTAIADDVSAYAYTYDTAGRLLSISNAGTAGVPVVLLSYVYDAAGRRTQASAKVNNARTIPTLTSTITSTAPPGSPRTAPPAVAPWPSSASTSTTTPSAATPRSPASSTPPP